MSLICLRPFPGNLGQLSKTNANTRLAKNALASDFADARIVVFEQTPSWMASETLFIVGKYFFTNPYEHTPRGLAGRF